MDSVLRRFGLKKGDQREGRQAAPKDLFAYSQARLTLFYSSCFGLFGLLFAV